MKRFWAREARFSRRVLRAYAATGLPELFGVRISAADPGVTEILLYDEIGYWGITAKDFVLALASIGDGPINLRINSPGGDTMDGVAIYNALKSRAGPVRVTVDGWACSAASFIAMAADPGQLWMHEQAMMMIHNCWGFCCGDRNDMTEMAAIQLKIDGQMAQIYAARCGKTAADVTVLMDAETYFTSSEAVEANFADQLVTDPVVVAKSGLKLMARNARGAGSGARAQVQPYDPDGDGDNDAAEALGLINSAAVLLAQAADALTGAETDDDEALIDPIVPGARGRRRPRAAKKAEWVVGATTDLAIGIADAWDGAAAADRVLEDAGFNGKSPDPAKARRAFLVWDQHNPNLKGSYRLPFADLVDGELKVVKAGLDAAASGLLTGDFPTEVKATARELLDAYEKRMTDDVQARQSARLSAQRRLRIAEAEAA